MEGRSSAFDVEACVRANRVHRSVYVDAAIFEAELTCIFERTWIYVGHESQVANPFILAWRNMLLPANTTTVSVGWHYLVRREAYIVA